MIDRNTLNSLVARIRGRNEYTTFGSIMEGRSYEGDTNLRYRFGFNGKEDDDETVTQDYGMRIYNPGLGKFLSVDPISSQFPMLSTYQFASLNPIVKIDLDGLEGEQFMQPLVSMVSGRSHHQRVIDYSKIVASFITRLLQNMITSAPIKYNVSPTGLTETLVQTTVIVSEFVILPIGGLGPPVLMRNEITSVTILTLDINLVELNTVQTEKITLIPLLSYDDKTKKITYKRNDDKPNTTRITSKDLSDKIKITNEKGEITDGSSIKSIELPKGYEELEEKGNKAISDNKLKIKGAMKPPPETKIEFGKQPEPDPKFAPRESTTSKSKGRTK